MDIEQVEIECLIPYARNARTHSPEQVAQIASSIREFGFCNPVLIDATNGIIAGHGRVLAAQKLKLEKVPCIRLPHLTEVQKRAYVLADNRIALSASWDDAMLANELSALHTDDFDMGLLGFEDDELSSLLRGEPGTSVGVDNPYTAKITAPIYAPTGECPEITSLFDHEKTSKLMADIVKANLPSDVAEFLSLAAERHTSFHFRHIAEYYCHAPKEVQDLMERSGLVIIDFNKAVEYGFVHMTENLAQLNNLEEADNGDA